MLKTPCSICLLLGCAASLLVAEVPSRLAPLSAVEIANKSVAASGGLQAWHSVQTLKLSGKLSAGGNQRSTVATTARRPSQDVVPPRPATEVQLPFVMELKRPRKVRFELQFAGKTAVQVYDGTNGWKLRPYLNRPEVEPYTAEELNIASAQPELDGPLVDYAAKGTTVTLDGTEQIDNRDTYRLKLTAKNGRSTHIWIDAETFLETKIEGEPRRLDGVLHPVEVSYKDYRSVNGVQIPFLLETKVLPASQAAASRVSAIPVERTVIEKAEVNPKLEDAAFTKPRFETTSASR